MYLKCVTEKTANQQKRFEDALLGLMKSKELDKISVVEICEAAGITRRIFYRLFETKQDCLISAIDHKLLASETYRSKTGRRGFCQILEFIKEECDFFNLLGRGNHIGLFMDRVLEYVNKENVHVKHLMGIYGSAEKELLIFNISGLIGLIFYWGSTNYEKTIEEMADMLIVLMKSPYAEK